MALNEIFPENGPADVYSLGPTTGTVNTGDPVKIGSLVGVAQTTSEATDGAATGLINSNAPGYITVKLDGVHRLSVTVTGTAKIGDSVLAAVSGSNTAVTLTVGATATGKFLFGILMEPSSAGSNLKLAVKPVRITGAALP
jgi:hypothetical protein